MARMVRRGIMAARMVRRGITAARMVRRGITAAKGHGVWRGHFARSIPHGAARRACGAAAHPAQCPVIHSGVMAAALGCGCGTRRLAGSRTCWEEGRGSCACSRGAGCDAGRLAR
eukprot:gene13708-biopygen1454